MNDTPRTDSEEERQRDCYENDREVGWPAFYADFDFARTLERELNAAQAEARRLRAIAEQAVSAMASVRTDRTQADEYGDMMALQTLSWAEWMAEKAEEYEAALAKETQP